MSAALQPPASSAAAPAAHHCQPCPTLPRHLLLSLYCSELDIMFNIEKAHFILDEMVTNGAIVETNMANILKPILLLEKVSK